MQEKTLIISFGKHLHAMPPTRLRRKYPAMSPESIQATKVFQAMTGIAAASTLR
jgi:hypothetical protein